MALFSNEEKANQWFEKKRWRDETTCPSCRNKQITNLKRKYFYQCKSCTLKFTVSTNTVMHRSHIPLHKWLYTMYCVVTARKGISSLQLSKEIGITQKSAWSLLHKIREGCNSNDSLLSNGVEIDETYIGGKEANKHEGKKLHAGRGGVGKQAVMGIEGA